MSFFSGLFGGGGGGQSQNNWQQELLRQVGIQQGAGAINKLFDTQFNDNFFNGRRDAALNYWQPQLDSQYADAQKQLEYALARQGGGESSAAAQQRGDLEKQYATNRQAIADKALGYETGARNSIEAARAGILAALNQTGDSTGAINSARSQIAALGQPDSFSPLTNLFSNAASDINQQLALERANQLSGGLVQPAYWSGLFGSKAAVQNS